jgi:predicted DNA-binding protein YlxM (UPF0122 family)
MDTLDKSIEVINLYDIYQDLLTDKQKAYFESYYFDDYSITEIAENMNVSRNAVHDPLKRTVKKLYDFESKLNIKQTNKERQIIISKIKEQNNDSLVANLIDELEKVE